MTCVQYVFLNRTINTSGVASSRLGTNKIYTPHPTNVNYLDGTNVYKYENIKWIFHSEIHYIEGFYVSTM